MEPSGSSSQPSRLFDDLDTRPTSGRQRPGIHAETITEKSDSAIQRVFNKFLNFFGFGHVEVQVGDSTYKVNVSSAKKYIANNHNLLGAMGISVEQGKLKGVGFDSEHISAIVRDIGDKKTKKNATDLKNYGLLLKEPTLLAYVAALEIALPRRCCVNL